MEIESSKRVKYLNVLTNLELIHGIQNPVIISISLNELKTELHRRVKNRLFQYCQKLCLRNRFDDSVAKDLFQNTLIKAFAKICDFEISGEVFEKKLENSVFKWLNRIAFNLFIDFLEERAKTKYLGDFLEELEEVPELEDFNIEVDESTNILLQEAWDDLDERERLIFYFCIRYNCLDNKDHLPDDVISRICSSLNTSKGNIRVIKNRALKRLRKRFQ